MFRSSSSFRKSGFFLPLAKVRIAARSPRSTIANSSPSGTSSMRLTSVRSLSADFARVSSL
ncbi:hypothetical protein [Agrobacterium sp. NPDC090283]|uniref:hypothetical protein n=1 Tax=Agrobacterium sp. NPDC090283 TaxID=3363920 RepID=UPI00383B9CB6